MSTGNGRCNFSNEAMGAEFYRGSGRALANDILSGFDVAQTKDFFSSLGMRIKDRDGYLYPASDQASTVLDLLRYELDRRHVTVHTGRRCRRFPLIKVENSFWSGGRGRKHVMMRLFSAAAARRRRIPDPTGTVSGWRSGSGTRLSVPCRRLRRLYARKAFINRWQGCVVTRN